MKVKQSLLGKVTLLVICNRMQIIGLPLNRTNEDHNTFSIDYDVTHVYTMMSW